ncbi:MAG: zinc-ribbon domain-containing protein [Blastocatellales bacterium]
MYCPRCGSTNTDTTKFCRQCGLPLQQITGYVATGGTGALALPPVNPAPPPQFAETAEMLALKHKRTLTILSICILPVVFAVISESVLALDELAAIPFLLIPLGIVWASFRYKTQLRRLQEQQLRQYYAQQQYQQPAQQSPAPQPQFQSQPHQPQLNAPRTNPLADFSQGSIVEDETRKLPEQRR